MATLHVLLLSNNQIHTIERGAFQDLVAVEKLRLNNNQIRHLPDLLFSNMMNLKRLILLSTETSGCDLEGAIVSKEHAAVASRSVYTNYAHP
ncbi:hypothetical protein P5V15_005505 [Pogonomyrmex californicus]